MFKKTDHGLILTGLAYDIVKQLAQVWLPAFGALYFGLAGVWGLPAADQVVGTVVVVDTFLGVFLGVSQRRYDASDEAYDGKIVVTTSDTGRKLFSLEIDGDPEEIEQKSSIAFRVGSRTAPLEVEEE